MNIVLSILSTVFWFIVILIPLVIVHEFGHLIMAKLVGVKVVEYGVGIPPRAIARRWKGMLWSLNWLPLGGFAKIYGDHDALDEAEDVYKTDPKKAREIYVQHRVKEILDSGDLRFFLKDNNLEYDHKWAEFEKNGGIIGEGSAHDDERMLKQLNTLADWEFDRVIKSKMGFCNVSWWRQIVILLGGVIFNMMTAVIIYFFLFGIISTPPTPVLPDSLNKLAQQATITYKSEYVKVLGIESGTPAADAGLEAGDDLISFAGVQLTSINTFSEFRDLVQSQSESEVTIVYRDKTTGQEVTKDIILQERDGKKFFGISGLGYFVRIRFNNLGDALVRSIKQTVNIFLLNFEVLGDLLASPFTQNFRAVQGVGGPIAIGSVGSTIFNLQGVSGILNIVAVISIGLAAFNLLPVPALDGGRFVIVTLNALTGRRNKRMEAIAISITFVALLVLAAVVAVYDIYRNATGVGFGL